MLQAVSTVLRAIVAVLTSRAVYQAVLCVIAIGLVLAAFWYASINEPQLSWWLMVYGVSVLGLLTIIADQR